MRLLLPMLFVAATAAAASDVVVLRGGAKIELKQPPVRQGNNVLLTRKDGTLLSVPAGEIDAKATAAARAAAPPPPVPAAVPAPETPAQAARATREGPKARVRLTDADVGHYLEPTGPGEAVAEAASPAAGGGRVEVSDYSQSKAGDNLIVKGTLRNAGAVTALNAGLTVTPLDDKGQPIDSVQASVSSGTIEPGHSVSFTATVPVGNKIVGVMRFGPRWMSQATPAEAAAAAPAPSALPGSGTSGAPPAAARPPAPAPTPYGIGLTYAAPAPSASMAPPPDGKNGYIPGAASPDNQPKPPQ
jgi:hypothetical protein